MRGFKRRKWDKTIMHNAVKTFLCLPPPASTLLPVSFMLSGNKTYQSVNEACHENANWIWEFHFHLTNYLMRLNDTECGCWEINKVWEENENKHRKLLRLICRGSIMRGGVQTRVLICRRRKGTARPTFVRCFSLVRLVFEHESVCYKL